MGKGPWLRRTAILISVASLVVSMMAGYAKLYFCCVKDYSPITLKIAIWYAIAAGPLAVFLARRRPLVSLAFAAVQFGLIWLSML